MQATLSSRRMGWGYGIDGNHREIGYLVVAECDEENCGTIIDRGLAYRCGHLGCESDDDMPGCGNYFCGQHLFIGFAYIDEHEERVHVSLCDACATAFEPVLVE